MKTLLEEFFNNFENSAISEVLVNSYDRVYFEINGSFKLSDFKFENLEQYKLFVQTLCEKAKIQFDFNTPCANGNFNSYRIHIVSAPLSESTLLSLRKIKKTNWKLEELVESSFQQRNLDTLKSIVTQKKNLLLVGPTGVGKTSYISALMSYIPNSERVVIIEDTDELITPNDLSVKLLTRFDIHGHLKDYNQNDLIKQSLRMRPHRLIVGEVRGTEAKDLLLALSTGHSGSLCSLHAEDAHQALLRLEMLIRMGAPEWDLMAIRRLMYFSLHYILTLHFDGNERTIRSLHQVAGHESHGLNLTKIF
jgi:pilus assembly protein CpaF